jgi:hypothetical protein
LLDFCFDKYERHPTFGRQAITLVDEPATGLTDQTIIQFTQPPLTLDQAYLLVVL